MKKTVFFLLTMIVSCAAIASDYIVFLNNQKMINTGDSLKYSIISDKSSCSVFFKKPKPTTLDAVEIEEVLKILGEAIVSHNNNEMVKAVAVEMLQIIDMDKYCMQFMPVMDKKEKVVAVNCFCDSHGVNWHKSLVFAKDGGICFFQLKINLNKKSFFDFFINGIG